MELEQRLRTSLIALVAASCAFAAPSASAQTSSTPTTATTTAATKPIDSGGILTTSSATKPPATATPDMINEAIQRSKARSERLRVNGIPERFGSEGPFVFDPTK